MEINYVFYWNTIWPMHKKQEQSYFNPTPCWVKTVSKNSQNNPKKLSKNHQIKCKKIVKKIVKKYFQKNGQKSPPKIVWIVTSSTDQSSPRNLRAQWSCLNLKFWPWFQRLKALLGPQGGSKLKNKIRNDKCFCKGV